jgi:hypothetical protein
MNDEKRFSALTPTVPAADGTPLERQILLPLKPPATNEWQSTSDPPVTNVKPVRPQGSRLVLRITCTTGVHSHKCLEMAFAKNN